MDQGLCYTTEFDLYIVTKLKIDIGFYCQNGAIIVPRLS